VLHRDGEMTLAARTLEVRQEYISGKGLTGRIAAEVYRGKDPSNWRSNARGHGGGHGIL
jgi:hypothetical protein